MNRLFFVSLLLIAFCACEKSSIYSNEFVLAYAELRIAEREYGETEEGKNARLQILQKYELSAETFEKKIEEIKSEPKIWPEFQKSLVVVLDSIVNSNKVKEEVKEEK